ncbi:MAG: response regulator [Planctomycetaceae bacterium]
MRLDEIPAEKVRRALELYLQHAYPGASRWRAPVVDLRGGATARDLIGRFSDENEALEARATHRYVLRLGNDRYPHMKLVLEESLLSGQYVFGVDCHDDMKVSRDSPDFQRWNALRERNRGLQARIEGDWRAAGIPTLQGLKPLLGENRELGVAARELLIVDDEEPILDTLRTLFERAGMQTRTARDGGEALARVAEAKPDLILMDFQMPGMDGVTCCEALKGDPKTRDIKVLLATASQLDLSTLTYADGFLVKPYQQDILFSLVRKLLS